MNSINNLDTAFVMSEIIAGDISIEPLDVINKLIANDEHEILADMLNDFYQIKSDKICKPIDDAIKDLFKSAHDNNI